jgi:colanic acid/amylovoran biosynthesis glycosyltransferase
VVPLGVDLDVVKRGGPYDPDGPVVAVGRLVEHKGFADLAVVASDVGREVVIAGDGPERSQLQQLGGESLKLPGPVAPREALSLLEGAAVVCAPSVIAPDGSRDGIPMVVKEALALGVPVVASDAVGNPEVVDADRGALFPVGERSALLEALRTLLARPPAERETMGRAGRAWAERHADLRLQTARLRDLFSGAVSSWVATRPPGDTAGRVRRR